jgi:hypothetical protein
VLGYYFQNRAWDHQNEARLAEAEREAATTVCIELSTLMDRRLFRMRQLDDVLGSEAAADELAYHLERYREVRYEWNDGLNRNLARTQTYFGQAVKSELEWIYGSFADIHGALRTRLDALRDGRPPGERLKPRLDELSDRIYDFNVLMGDLLREGRVGRRHPDAEARR